MSDILTPEEVDELRPANEPKYLMQNTTTTRLIALIDALAEALRAQQKALMATAISWLVDEDFREFPTFLVAAVAVHRVAAWLEET